MSLTRSIIVSDAKPLSEYKLSAACDAYVLVNNHSLQVKLERMPPNTAERLHNHALTQQFIHVLQGVASMSLDEEQITLKAGEGVLVEAGCRHSIENNSNEVLRFVVTSQPAVNAARMEAAITH